MLLVAKPGTTNNISTISAVRGEKRIYAIRAFAGKRYAVTPFAIDVFITELAPENPEVIKEYKAGKVAVLNSLIGKIMKDAKGTNPTVLRVMLVEIADKS